MAATPRVSRASVASGGLRGKPPKQACSFLKKRTKKLSSACTRASRPARTQTDKVFLLLFIQKKKTPP
jgi:hypothetical protein